MEKSRNELLIAFQRRESVDSCWTGSRCLTLGVSSLTREEGLSLLREEDCRIFIGSRGE